MKLENSSLYNINGGGFSLSLGIIITAAVVFVAGILDGIVNPQKCDR